MNIFAEYAEVYDLLYRDKDYAGEAEYVSGLIRRYDPQAVTLLDLGCGTGHYDLLLAEKGFSIAGVDLAPSMVAKARERGEGLQENLRRRVKFFEGDIRTFRSEQTYDAVVSLFHVVSYQTGNDDLLEAFTTARAHLEAGGLFVFDCWYGPGVLSDRPQVRVKRIREEGMDVCRIAEPVMHPNENRVDVFYEVQVRKTGSPEVRIQEVHRMRYLFVPEVDFLLKRCAFERLACEEWLSGRRPGFQSWNVCFIAQAK